MHLLIQKYRQSKTSIEFCLARLRKCTLFFRKFSLVLITEEEHHSPFINGLIVGLVPAVDDVPLGADRAADGQTGRLLDQAVAICVNIARLSPFAPALPCAFPPATAPAPGQLR